MENLNDESFRIKKAKEKLETLTRFHDKLFRKFKKPLKTGWEGKNVAGKPTKVVFKIITAIGTYTGTGTVHSTAIENALFSVENALINFKKKRKLNKEKRVARKTKLVKIFDNCKNKVKNFTNAKRA